MPARDSKPNNTGRASGQQSGRAKKVSRPPKGEPFVQLTRELLSSPAWRAMSVNCHRLVSFLMVDHMNHAGLENGNLMATYDQLVEFGLTRSQIASAVQEAEYLRLLRVDRGGRWAGTNRPSIYELTFFAKQRPYPIAATDDWKKTTPEEAGNYQKPKRQKNRIPSSQLRTTVVRKPALPDGLRADSETLKPQKSASACSSQSDTPSISTLGNVTP